MKLVNMYYNYVTTRGELSSTFDEFLACGRNSTAIMTNFGRHVWNVDRSGNGSYLNKLAP